jgi:hypothetical protein
MDGDEGEQAMLTTAITGAIAGAMAWFGVTPSPYFLAGLWVAVKVVVVAGITGLGALSLRKKRQSATPEA